MRSSPDPGARRENRWLAGLGLCSIALACGTLLFWWRSLKLLDGPGRRRPFQFGLAPPPGWPEVGPGAAIVARGSASPWPAPGLVVAEDEPALDRLCVDGVG